MTETTPKPQGKGIVKALGQKGTTGNFKKIEAAKGKGAAIGALQNKLATKRGQKPPYTPDVRKSAANIQAKLSSRGKRKTQVGFD